MPSFQTTRFSDIEALWPEFDALLSRHGVEHRRFPGLARLRDATEMAVRCHRDRAIPLGVDGLAVSLDLANAWFFLKTLLTAATTSFDGEIARKLTLLEEADPRFLAAGEKSNERDLLFELVCGAIVAKFGRDVRVVDPPDVLFRYGAETVGLACKQAYGNRNTTVKAVRTGIEQLARGGSSTGFVVVNLTKVFPHDRLIVVDPYDGSLWSSRFVRGVEIVFDHELSEFSRSYFDGVRGSIQQDAPPYLGSCNGVIFLVQTAATVRGSLSVIAGTCFMPLTAGRIAAHHFPSAFNQHVQNFEQPPMPHVFL